MKLSLTKNALEIIKFVLSSTGEKEINGNGQEQFSPRRMNGVDAAQRRHFYKNASDATKELEEQIKTAGEKHNELYEEKKKARMDTMGKVENEPDNVYQMRLRKDLEKNEDLIASHKALVAMSDTKVEIELTDKTAETVKKYLKEFSDGVGFLQGDDKYLEEFETAGLL